MNVSYFLKRMFLIIILVYFCYGAYFLLAQRSFIYYPDYPTRSDFYDCLIFADSDKVDMGGTRAYYKHVGEKIVVVYHGNAGSACDREYFKSIFENAGYSYLFVEYTGYGGDGKKPSRAALLKDAENVIVFLKTKEHKETALLTESIGAGVASYHASLMPPNKMIFIAPFDNLANVAKAHFPFYLYPMTLWAKFSKENFDNGSLLQNYEGELTIIHGTEDHIIPLKYGRSLYEKAPMLNKRFVAIEGAGHNDIYGFERTWETINAFLLQ